MYEWRVMVDCSWNSAFERGTNQGVGGRRRHIVLMEVGEMSSGAAPHDVMRPCGVPPLPPERKGTEVHME